MFVASGTMGNLASLLAHCGRGREVILGDESHIYHYENGGASALGGLVFHPVRTLADGTLPLDALRAAIHLPAHHYHYYHYTRPGRDLPREHAQPLRRPDPLARVLRRGRRHRRRTPAAHAPRRRAALQRRRGGRAPGDRLDAARVVGAVLSLERPLGAGRLPHLRLGRLHPRSAADAEDPGRRDAAGRRDRGPGHRRVDRRW